MRLKPLSAFVCSGGDHMTTTNHPMLRMFARLAFLFAVATPPETASAQTTAFRQAVAEGASRDDLVAGLIRHGHRHARALHSEDDLERLVREQTVPGDMVVCLGAGTISAWANGLPERLTD